MKIHTIKHTIFLCCLLAVGLISCDQSYDPVFSESAESRLQAALDEYNATLQGAQYGWKASLVTASGIEYFYYFEFKGDGQVNILSDFNASTAGTVQASTWQLKALQTATLSFPTYSYVHLPADPDGDVNGGPDGVGRASDFEFAFAGTSSDTLLMEGIQRGARMTLFPATAVERQQLLDGRIRDILAYGLSGNGLRATLSGDRNITFALNPDRKRITAQYISDDGLRVVVSPMSYSVSMNGILLGTPVHAYGQEIRELLWDGDRQEYYINVGNSRTVVGQNPDLFFFEPTIPVQDVIGNDFIGIMLADSPDAKPIKGQSALYASLYKAVADGLAEVNPTIILYYTFMVFDVNTNTMYFVVNVVQNDQLFSAEYSYRYTLTGEGVYTFSLLAQNANAEAIRYYMNDILGYIEGDHFQSEFVGCTEALTAGFFSVEHPEFSLAGTLTN